MSVFASKDDVSVSCLDFRLEKKGHHCKLTRLKFLTLCLLMVNLHFLTFITVLDLKDNFCSEFNSVKKIMLKFTVRKFHIFNTKLADTKVRQKLAISHLIDVTHETF